MKLKPWPYVKFNNEWSIPDEVLAFVWSRIEENGKIEELFYEGGMRTPSEFIEFFRNPDKFLVLGVNTETKEIKAFGFLSGFDTNKAYAHFSFINGYVPGVGEMIIDFWRKMESENGERFLDVLIGITPESYTTVLKIIQKWGFNIVGTIPMICNMNYKNKKEGGVISYLTLGG